MATIKPQDGFQTDVLSNPADIIICGGAAGAGKTAVLLMNAARWHFLPQYGAIIFRRTFPEIMQQGGLWEQSQSFYTPLGGDSVTSPTPLWRFPSSAKIGFSHLQHEKDLYSHQGGAYAFIGFDELTHFSRKEFIYLLSRNRSICGIDPVMMGTCNPDPNSWVANFIEWFIDQETGFPIPERCGQIRYFTNDNNVFVWGDSPEEVVSKCPHIFNDNKFKDSGIDATKLIKSMTFIPGSIYENKILLDVNASYLGNLMAMDADDKNRLLDGNWKTTSDNKELFPLLKIKDLFTNLPINENKRAYYIAIDHARLGKDFAVLTTWLNYRVVRIDILPKSLTPDILKVVHTIRQYHQPIPVSNIICDQDGIGVVDALGCNVFQGAAAAFEVSTKKETLKVEYKNRRTQNYFELSEMMDNSQISIDLNNVWIWNKVGDVLQPPQRITSVKWGGSTYTIEQLITDDLRTVRRHNSDKEGKKQITPKEQQKNAIGGRSPDFGDSIMMRIAFEFIAQPKFPKRV